MVVLRCVKGGGVNHAQGDALTVLVTRDLDGPEARKMRLLILAVDQCEAALDQMLRQKCEGELAGMVGAAKHALDRKYGPERHAEGAAEKLPVAPGFDGMHCTEIVELAVGGLHPRCEPSSLAIAA